MPLILFEIHVGGRDEAAVNASLSRAETLLAASQGAAKSSVVEAQATADRDRLYLVVETADAAAAEDALTGADLTPALRKEVRLVGQDLEAVRARRRPVNFLVEWDLPAGLTMEKYLQRKAEKTPLYAQVPEVRFERTYVCEDMAKCLCFYDGPDEAAIRRARDAVGAPVDRLAPLAAPLATESGPAAGPQADAKG